MAIVLGDVGAILNQKTCTKYWFLPRSMNFRLCFIKNKPKVINCLQHRYSGPLLPCHSWLVIVTSEVPPTVHAQCLLVWDWKETCHSMLKQCRFFLDETTVLQLMDLNVIINFIVPNWRSLSCIAEGFVTIHTLYLVHVLFITQLITSHPFCISCVHVIHECLAIT